MHRIVEVISGSVLAASALLAAPSSAAAQGNPGQASSRVAIPRRVYDPLTQIPSTPLPTTIKDGFVFAAVGDLIGPGRPFGPLKDPELETVARILRDADAASGNNEGALFDLETFTGFPGAENGGGNPLGSTAVARDLKAMGFTFLSKANNHAVDYGLEGLHATERSITDAGMLFAGSGRNRFEARRAAFLETPKGRVSFVSTASTFVPWSVAGLAEGDMPDRPGISVLHTQRLNVVTPGEMQKLLEIANGRQAVGGRGRGGAPTRTVDPKIGLPSSLTVLGQTYKLGEKPGVTYEMNDLDLYEILRGIRAAKEVSDVTVFTIHAHETGSGSEPADFLTQLYHMAIDAGADIVAAHGQHVLRGIEIYKGRPIFHGLGSFFYMMELDRTPTRESLESMHADAEAITYTEYLHARFTPDRASLESMIAVTEFAGGRVKEVRLYPLDLRFGVEPAHRNLGVPRLADAVLGRKILERLQEESDQFGTKISIEKNIGIIRP